MAQEAPLPRHLAHVVGGLLEQFRIVVVTGPRQVGKSTLARALIDERGGEYLTLDRPDLLERALADPIGMTATSPARDGTVVIDEVQLAPELLRAVKLAVDSDERPGRFLLTGSANLLRMRSVSESLAGRAAYVELAPLTFSERHRRPAPGTLESAFTSRSAEEFLDSLTPASSQDSARLRESLCEAVVSGGMPGTLHMGTDGRRRWYASYVSTFVERDLWQLGRVDDVVAFRRLFALSMLRTTGLLNRSDLSADAGLDHRTVSRYLDLLEVGYQLRTLRPFASNRTTRLVKMPKLFARNSGMAAHVMRTDDWRTALEAGLAGPLYETWMISELLALDGLGSAPSSASFWRTSAGSEVDLLLERGARSIGFEMKASSTVRWSDARALAAVRDNLGDRFGLGIVAYLGEELRVLTERVCAVPAWMLLGVAEADDSDASATREYAAQYTTAPGAALVTARNERGERIETIAALLGVDDATVERWERTAYDDAPLSVVRALAERLGVVVRLG